MKKSAFYIGVALCCLSAAWFIAGIFSDWPLFDQFNGLWGALLGIGIGNIVRWRTVTRKPDGDYARELRQTVIDQKDERNVMLRDRAGYLTFVFTLVVLCVLMFAAMALEALEIWTPFSGYAVWLCFGLLALILVCDKVLHTVLNKRL